MDFIKGKFISLGNFFKASWLGLLICLLISVPCWYLGKLLPVVGGPVFAILIGMVIALFLKKRDKIQSGITLLPKKFSSLQLCF